MLFNIPKYFRIIKFNTGNSGRLLHGGIHGKVG